jgi:Cache domain
MSDGQASILASLAEKTGWRQVSGPLFWKYVGLFLAVVCAALLSSGLFEIIFSYREHTDALIRIQREQAEGAAEKIGHFIKEIENQMGWTTQLTWTASDMEHSGLGPGWTHWGGTLDQRRFDVLRLFRQVPAITELAQLDPTGKEQLRVSRFLSEGSNHTDYSHDPKFTEAVAKHVYYGPVYVRRQSEPFMTLSLAGTRRDAGVTVVEVGIKLVWDVVSKIKVGEHGQAYVIDADGRLIAHPDISLVLRNTDMTKLAHVQAALLAPRNAQEFDRARHPLPPRAQLSRPTVGRSTEPVQDGQDIHGHKVLSAYAPVSPLGWLVFVELPAEEAYASLYASIKRSGTIIFTGLVLAFLSVLFLARRMVVLIQIPRNPDQGSSA